MSSFVHISEASTIALHCLALIARSKEKLNAPKLAGITSFSKNHLAKILHMLVRYNYLSSLRGPNGGFTMNRNPKSISLFEIYELMEGQLQKFQCAVTCNKCYFEVCIFGNHPHRFSGEFKAYLKEKSLDDFTLKRTL